MASEQIQQIQQILDVTPDAIVIIDDSWNFSYANPQAIHLLRSGSVIGENLWQLFPGNREEPFFSSYMQTMQGRVPTEFEAFYPAPLHSWYRISARPFDRAGIIIFFSDITDRKQAELARDRSATLLEQVLNTTNEGITSLDRNWRYTYLNRRGREILGADIQLGGPTLWELYPQAIGTDFERNFRRTMDDRVPTNFTAFYPAPLNNWLNLDVRPADDGIIVFFRDITADHLAAEVLRDQQTQLAFVQQATGVATWEIDLSTREITFGAGSASVFGYPLEELGSTSAFRRIIHPESLLHHPTLVEVAASPDDTHLREYRLIAADGSTRWIESRSRAVLTDGVATHLRGIAIDITARKRNDEALRESERRYRVLADLNPQALWIGNPQGQVTYANQGFLDYLGHATADLDGWLTSFDPADRDRVIATWTHSVETGDEYDIEARLLRGADGASRWWHLRALPVRDNDRRIIQWLGVATDIDDASTFAETLRLQQLETERKRAELEAIYQTAPIGLALFDPIDFRYLRLNHLQAAFFALPPEQILGKRLTEMAPIPGLRELFEQVARGQPVINHILEGELATHPGEHRFWTVNYLPVHAPDGSVQAISAASLEITHQRRAEAALIQSEKLAAVGRLASSISHEINNPLEAITNLLYLIAQHDGLPPDLRVYVNMAQSELSRVSQIATQTLRFHRQAVKPTLVTAAQLVDAVLNLYQGRLANSGIRTDIRYDSHTPVLCFENDIRQVLNNLIANAIDAMRTGGRLIVRAHNGSDHTTGRRGLRILIADTGHGMSRATLSRLFEPFFTTKDLNGTGLGLWISKDIVDRHDGRLTVRSTEDTVHKGTIFSLFLPERETAPA